MTKTEYIDIQCPQCGYNEFENLKGLRDDEFAKCSNCHFEIMLADLKEAGIEQAKEVAMSETKEEVEKMFKNVFKSFK